MFILQIFSFKCCFVSCCFQFRFSSLICCCSDFERSTDLFFIDFDHLKWKNLSTSDKNVRQKKNTCLVLFPLKNKRSSFQSIFLWEIFSLDSRWRSIGRMICVCAWRIVPSKIVTIRFSVEHQTLSQSPWNLSFIRIGGRTHRFISSLDENKRTFFLNRTSKDEVGQSFSSVNKCLSEQSSRQDSQEKISSMKCSLKRSTIFFIKLISLRIKFPWRWFVVRHE